MKPGAAPILGLLAAAVATATQAQRAADIFPNKPVRIIVGSSPGGGADFTARIVAEKLAESWGNPIIVENRSSGAIYGLEATARANPDDYALGLAASTGYVQAVLKIKLPFSLRNDVIPVIQLTSQPYLLVVPPSLPAVW